MYPVRSNVRYGSMRIISFFPSFCLSVRPSSCSATGYTIEPTLKKIQDDEVDNIYHGTASLSSLTDSPKKLSQDKYDYRDEVISY